MKVFFSHNFQNLETPLHVSARYGHVESIEQLCKCGANVNAVDEVMI
jgi:ankyrin repeat protein